MPHPVPDIRMLTEAEINMEQTNQNSSSVMVCVTGRNTAEGLIKEGVRIAAQIGAELQLVHVAGTGQQFFSAMDEASALDYLFRISRECQAELFVLKSDDVPTAIAERAIDTRAKLLIFGSSGQMLGPGNVIYETEKLLEGTGISVRVV